MEKVEIPGIKNIVVVASGKGGVGKSTIAAGLAVKLAKEGYKIGIMDGDIYGPSIPTLFDLQDEKAGCYKNDEGKMRITPFEKYGIKIMSVGFVVESNKATLWRGLLASNAFKQILTDTEWGNLDYLIIDTPPGTGDIHLSLLQSFKINGVVIVTTPQVLSSIDVKKSMMMFRNPHLGVPMYGVVENMSWFTPSKHPNEKYFLYGQGGGEVLANQFNIPLLAKIPTTEQLCYSCDGGKLEYLFDNQWVNEGFDALIDGIINPKPTYVRYINGEKIEAKSAVLR